MEREKSGRVIATKRSFRQNRLSLRIALITFFSALVGILGLLRLSWNMYRISETYDHIMERDYQNIVYMEELARKMNEHESLLYHHLTEPNAQERAAIESTAVRLQSELTEQLIAFGSNMNGTSYERYYHSIYSGLVGYFNNVDLIFSFNNLGDMETAAYYMEVTLESNIEAVNRTFDELDSAIEADMRSSRASNDDRIQTARIEAAVIMVLVALFAVFSILMCTAISQEMVSRDLLTGAESFDSLLKRGGRLERSGRLKGYTAVAVSLKNFKFINQEYGSTTGDEVLVQYAQQLLSSVESGEIVARNGGDNFIALLRSEHTDHFLEAVQTFHTQIRAEGGSFDLPLYSRCGVAPAREYSTINIMVDACQLALGTARSSGEDIVYFENAMSERLQIKKRTLEQYRKALEEREFMPYYQPKVDMVEHKLMGAEALARWNKDGRLVPPSEFIPFLEEEGELEALDFYIFEQVCRDLRDWMDRGITPVRVSSNFSKLNLKNVRFAEQVLRMLEKYRIDGKYVQIEITESSGYEDYDALRRFVARMHENGVSISIDDFGTGYSSLSMLKDVDADVVKLDRSFLFGVREEETDEIKEKLISNIIRMIHDLDRRVICEGVETQKHVDFLLEAGCVYAQGFYYDKPLPRETYEERLRSPKY